MISADNLYQDIQYLTEDIGIRLTGSEQEWQAARYLQKRFEQYVPKCEIEEFPVIRRVLQEETLRVRVGGQWENVPIRTYDMSPSTDGTDMEAELVFFDSHTDYQRKDLSYLRGKAVVHYGGDIDAQEDYFRIMQAQPAFLLMVNTRYTAEHPVSNSLLPALVEKHGAVPTAAIAFTDVWRLLTQGADRAALKITGTSGTGSSCNVIAEIPGTDPKALCLYAGAHMDSVAGSVGADDNAGGCAILVELARVLSQVPHRHTIRLIAFGAEEQLSVGSAEYTRRHRREIEKTGRFMCNFDSCTTAVGFNRFTINASTSLRDKLREVYHAHDVYYVENLELDPCNDAFPFMAAGVPGLTLMRSNCDQGRFYHHQPTNTLQMLSMEKAAQLAQASAALLSDLADCREPWELGRIDPDKEADVQALWQEIFGGWK